MIRVAALELSSRERYTEESVAECLRLIERTVREHGSQLVVCPELYVAAIASPGDWQETTAGIADRLAGCAREHSVWIACNVGTASESEPHLFSPSGERVEPLSPRLYETPIGLLALCSHRELFDSQIVRELARAGALLICGSAGDAEVSLLQLHLAARAVESRVYLAVASDQRAAGANTDPEALLPELPMDGAALPHTPTAQIVEPGGELQATADADGRPALAELDLTRAVDKQRLDGTPLLELRERQLYQCEHRRTRLAGSDWAEDLPVAALDVPHAGSVEEILLDARVYLEALCERGVQLVVLPELFCFGPDLASDPEPAADAFLSIVRELSCGCRRSGMHVVTSLVERVGDALVHMGVLIGQGGIVMRQPQLHVPLRHAWARSGDRIESAPLPWGRLAIAVGEDALIPELSGAFEALEVKLVTAPLSPFTALDAGFILPAQADEHRFGVVAAVPLARSSERTRFGSHLVVDPNAWPARRALPEQRVLHGTLRLSQIASIRGGHAPFTAWTQGPEALS
jgi:deaminated glutathione amidase